MYYTTFLKIYSKKYTPLLAFLSCYEDQQIWIKTNKFKVMDMYRESQNTIYDENPNHCQILSTTPKPYKIITGK